MMIRKTVFIVKDGTPPQASKASPWP